MGRGKESGFASPDVGRALDRGAARKAEPEQFRGLVESFAERVVDGGAEPLVAARSLDQQKLRVAARDQQQADRAGRCRP